MVRTKADGCGRKAVAAKAPRKALNTPSAASTSFASPGKSGAKNAGGNPVCTRPTPTWQKGMGAFVISSPKRKSDKENESPDEEEEDAGCSTTKISCSDEEEGGSASTEQKTPPKKNNIIDSDSDDDDD